MQLSDAEWKVMEQVWRRERSSVRDVLEGLEEQTGWAYSTVRTLLTRLADKGALAVTTRANARLYRPTISREDARTNALSALVQKAFGGTLDSLVHHLVDADELPDGERARLAELLESLRRDEADDDSADHARGAP